MRINEQNFVKLLSNKFEKYKALLIYGPDYGQIEEKISLIKKQFLAVKTFQIEKNKNEFSEIIDSLANQDLFAQSNQTEKIAIIKLYSSSAEIINKLAEKRWDNILIFQAKELLPNSPLRKLFEQDADFAILPCYVDEPQAVKSLFKQEMSKHGIKYDPALEEIVAQYIDTGDRMLIRRELENLVNFAGEEKKLNLAECQKYLSLTSVGEVEDLVFNLFIKEFKYFELNLTNCINKGISLLNIINFITRLINNAQLIHHKIKIDNNFEEAFNSISPKIFFKHKVYYQEILKLYDQKKLNFFTEKLFIIENEVKKRPLFGLEMFKFFIFQNFMYSI